MKYANLWVLACTGLVVPALALCAATDASQGVRFNSPGVLDLAERTQTLSGAPMLPSVLSPADADSIFNATTQTEDPPVLKFSEEIYDCQPPSRKCSLAQEADLPDISGGVVSRKSKDLQIAIAGKPPVIFTDWSVATSKSADGDDETHWYLGALPGNGYQRVEVQFGHDAPGNFLINGKNGKIAFVHNGSDLVVPSNDGLRLITFNSLNPPFSFRVALLDAQGPTLDLQCALKTDGANVTAAFKGWHDTATFDLVLESRAARSKLAQRTALRFTRKAAGWTMAASNPDLLRSIDFTCVGQAPGH